MYHAAGEAVPRTEMKAVSRSAWWSTGAGSRDRCPCMLLVYLRWTRFHRLIGDSPWAVLGHESGMARDGSLSSSPCMWRIAEERCKVMVTVPGAVVVVGGFIAFIVGCVLLGIIFLVIRSSLRKMRAWREATEQNRKSMTSPTQMTLNIICVVSLLVLMVIGVGVWIANFNTQMAVPAHATVRPLYFYPDNFVTVPFAIVVGAIFVCSLAATYVVGVVKSAVVESKRELPENLRRAKEQTEAKTRGYL
jgi:hypothetical protein